MKYCIMIVLAVFSFSTLAQQAPECKIDPDWKQSKIQETLEACKQSTTAVVPQAVAQDVSAYAEIAKGVAEAIGIAAREVGVAVDEFVKTDTGKMTVALIVWHVAGDDIKGMLFGIPGILFAVWLWFTIAARLKRTGEYVTVKNRWGREVSVHKLKAVADFDGPDGFSFLILSVFCGAIVVVCLANIF